MTTPDPAAGATPSAPVRAPVWATGGAVGVLIVPLAVAAVALHGKPWYPTGDLAQMELRLVGFASHPPLIGPAGRIGTLAQQGNHPGPLMFWLAWPVYRLLGATSWGLEASVLTLAAMWTALVGFFARRRGALGLLLAVMAALAIVARAYHADTLSQPWNPWMPLLAFFAFVVLIWSVLCDDLLALPIAVLVGSYCLQAEIEYSLMVVVLLAAVVAWQMARAWRSRGLEGSPLREIVRWHLIAVAAGVVVWAAPVVQQLRGKPGNLTIIFRYFMHPPEQPIGYVSGLRVALVQFDPVGNVLTGSWATSHGNPLPGALLLLVWALLSWRTAKLDGRLLRLNVTVGLSAILAVASSAQILGFVWGYLVEWMWAITALMVVAVCWGLMVLLRPRIPAGAIDRLRLVPGVGLVGVAVLFAVQASSITPTAYVFPRQEAVLSSQTLSHIDHSSRYLLLWDQDPIGLGGTGFGLMLQLDKAGVRNGALPQFRAAVQDRRVMVPGQYDKVLHVVTGPGIIEWRAEPSAREVACVDLRTSAERAESTRLERSLTDALTKRGLPVLVNELHNELFALTLDDAMPSDLRADAKRLVDFQEATAVFETPASMITPSPPAAAVGARSVAAGGFGSAPTCP